MPRNAYRGLKVETSASAAADWQCYQDSTMAQLQTSKRKGDTHTAYKVVQHSCKPSNKPAQRLRDKPDHFLLTPEQHSLRWAENYAELRTSRQNQPAAQPAAAPPKQQDRLPAQSPSMLR